MTAVLIKKKKKKAKKKPFAVWKTARLRASERDTGSRCVRAVRVRARPARGF